MDRTLKATLLSALVFPGVGQLYLGRTVRGLLLLGAALGAAWYFAKGIYVRAQAIADQILSGSLPLDPILIADRLEQGDTASPMLNLAATVMIVCWLLSIADAWFVGRPPPPTLKG